MDLLISLKKKILPRYVYPPYVTNGRASSSHDSIWPLSARNDCQKLVLLLYRHYKFHINCYTERIRTGLYSYNENEQTWGHNGREYIKLNCEIE